MTFRIRCERPGDEAAIRALTEAAFRTQPHSEGDEQDLIDALRRDGDLTLSLVAQDGARIVGHIAFSPVTISDLTTGWYGLGPVSVLPEMQRRGIGARLIQQGLAEMRNRGAAGIVLLGSPDLYGRFGFSHDPELRYPGPPPRYFQRLVLAGEAPAGVVSYAAAFG